MNGYKYLIFFLFFFFQISCERQTLYDACKHKTALIPVKINWIYSGINPNGDSEDDLVHKVSFRFFPVDGGEPFELYLEGNVNEGYLEVPIGEYDLLIMNESVMEQYWKDYVKFSDINSFGKISAEILPFDPSLFEYYKPLPEEQFTKDIPKMAACSVRDYQISFETVTETRGTDRELLRNHTLYVDMQRITHDCKVIANVKNLKYAQLIRGANRKLANKIYLGSRIPHYSPATHLFVFNGRKPVNGSQTDGTTERTFRTFGILPQTVVYSLGVDIILTDGCRFMSDGGSPFEYDVTHYLYDYFNKTPDDRVLKDYIEIPLTLSLPQVDGGIDVGDWGDDDDIIIK
ncbi:MAG: DUF5119 domain-containing protein [Bacteroidales bacterium]